MKMTTFISFVLVNVIFLCGSPFISWATLPGANNYETVELEAKRGGYELIDLETLWPVYQKEQDKVLLVDTRQEWEYHSGYIQGAVNFPMEPTWLSRLTRRGALEQFLGDDKLQTMVFY